MNVYWNSRALRMLLLTLGLVTLPSLVPKASGQAAPVLFSAQGYVGESDWGLPAIGREFFRDVKASVDWNELWKAQYPNAASGGSYVRVQGHAANGVAEFNQEFLLGWINKYKEGINFGWPLMNGEHVLNSYVRGINQPYVLEYSHEGTVGRGNVSWTRWYGRDVGSGFGNLLGTESGQYSARLSFKRYGRSNNTAVNINGVLYQLATITRADGNLNQNGSYQPTTYGAGISAGGRIRIRRLNKRLCPGHENDNTPEMPLYCSASSGSPGAKGLRTSLNLMSGNLYAQISDPVATRGYPIVCNISLNSQAAEPGRQMANATFTYDIHILRKPVRDEAWNESEHWFLVDGDGTQLDFGPDNAAPVASSGVYSRLVRTAQGFELLNAGPPENIKRAGNFRYTFNNGGLLLTVQDPAGNTQALTYVVNSLRKVRDLSTNKEITFQHNEYSGNITQIVSGNGESLIKLEYAANHLTNVSVENRRGEVVGSTAFTYDTNGRLEGIVRDKDPQTKIQVTYTDFPIVGTFGNIGLANVSYDGGKTNIDWDSTPPLDVAYRVAETNNKGGTTFYDYDDHNELVAVTTPTLTGAAGAGYFTFRYDHNHNRIFASDGLVSEWREYDQNGQLTRRSNGAGEFAAFTYQGNDLLSAVDSLGTLLGLTYAHPTQLHLPTALTDSGGSVWNYALNAYGQTTQVTPPAGSPEGVTRAFYDEKPTSLTLGYPLAVTNGSGDVTTFDGYSPLGDLTKISTYPINGDPTRKNTTIQTYDAAQRPLTLQYPDGKTFRRAYEGLKLKETTDEAGTRMGYTFCAACGKLEGLTGPLGWALQWMMDGDHDTTAFIDARGKKTQYAYGQARELTQVTYPDNTRQGYKYYPNGFLGEITNGRGQKESRGYDGAGRLESRAFPTTGQTPIQYKWNADGTLQEMRDSTGITSFTYGADRRVATVTYDYRKSGLLALQRLDYVYFPDGRLDRLTWTNGSAMVGVWQYDYDAAGRMSSVTAFGAATRYSYDGEGKLAAQTNSNGTQVSYAYNDARGWPVRITYLRGRVPFADYRLSYDQGLNTVGNLTGVQELDGSQAQYGYDALYRLLGESRTGTNAYTRFHEYDLAGNLTTLNGASFATYDDANKIKTIAGGAASHDADGNILSVSAPGLPAGRFFWDDQSKLIRQSRGVQTVTYGYDGFGRRVWSQVGSNPKTFFIFHGSLLLGEINAGTPSAAYTWGADGLVSERLLGLGKTLWYHYGPQGETRQLTDATGTVVDAYAYTAYGVPVTATSNNPNSFRYGGKYGYYADGPMGLMLCGARWYSPHLTRWISRDPIGYNGGSNLYIYADTSPLTRIDPFGQDALDVLTALSKIPVVGDAIADKLEFFESCKLVPVCFSDNPAYNNDLDSMTCHLRSGYTGPYFDGTATISSLSPCRQAQDAQNQICHAYLRGVKLEATLSDAADSLSRAPGTGGTFMPQRMSDILIAIQPTLKEVTLLPGQRGFLGRNARR